MRNAAEGRANGHHPSKMEESLGRTGEEQRDQRPRDPPEPGDMRRKQDHQKRRRGEFHRRRIEMWEGSESDSVT